MRKLGIVLAALLAAACIRADERGGAPGPNEDGTAPALVRVAGEGLLHSRAFEYLTELSDDVGARVTGSPNAEKAVAWGVAKMKAMGLENVHTEKWQMWRGWTRGSAEAQLLDPVRRKLSVDAMGWTGSTPTGGAEGDVMTVNVFDLDRESKNASRWKGKVLLLIQAGPFGGDIGGLFARFGSFLKVLQEAGAIAVIGGQAGSKAQGMHLTHTGILGFEAEFQVPVVSITAEDQGQLERYLAAGKIVRVRFNVQNTLTSGPVECANVVGEIRGREHPEQVFVVGAHFDSWDLAEGSTDNGTGSASVLGAAEAIARSAQRPRRTIRFVLFTGEEQGLLGSFAYVKQHEPEMANHLGGLVLDTGQGPLSKFQLGRDDLEEAFEPFVNFLSSFGQFRVERDASFDTDTGPFILAGIPGINMEQNSPDYKFTHHSAADTLEAVKPETLAQNATLMALTAYWIADRPSRIAEPWPKERTARMLVRQHQDGFLKAFHIWPFGDLGKDEKD
jgi:carboxypeptidase Q